MKNKPGGKQGARISRVSMLLPEADDGSNPHDPVPRDLLFIPSGRLYD